MGSTSRKPFQFSLRTALVLLLLIGAGLGFWLQQQRLAKARRVLAAHGLAMELPDLKPGEVRATVTDRVEKESYVLLSLLIESRQSESISIKRNGKFVLGAVLQQAAADENWTGEVRVLADKIRPLDKDGGVVIKRVLTLGPRGSWAQIEALQSPPGDPKLSEFVKVHVAESTIFELGESIPLIDIGDEQLELVVQ